MTKDYYLPTTTVYDSHLAVFKKCLKKLNKKIRPARVEKTYRVMGKVLTCKTIIEELLQQPLTSEKQRVRFQDLYKPCMDFCRAKKNSALVRKYSHHRNFGIELYRRYQEVKMEIYLENIAGPLSKIKWHKYQLDFDQYNFLKNKFGRTTIRKILQSSIKKKLEAIRNSGPDYDDQELIDIKRDLKQIHMMADQILREKKSTSTEQLLVLIRDTEVSLDKWCHLEDLLQSVRTFRQETKQTSIINFSIHRLLHEIERDKSLLGNKVSKLLETI